MQLRFALVLGLLLAGFAASWLAVRVIEQREMARLRAEAIEDQRVLLERSLGRIGRTVQNFSTDLAQTNELRRFAAAPNLAWAREKLPPVLAKGDADALWVLKDDGTPLVAVARPGVPEPPATPLAPVELRALLRGARPPHVFTLQGRQLVELFGAAIGQGEAAAAEGWLVVAHQWDEARLATLSSLMESDVHLATPDTAALHREDEAVGVVTLVRPLTDWQGRTLRMFVARHRVPQLAVLLDTDVWQTRLFLVFGLLVMTGLGLGLHAWVLRPLRAIRASLASGQTEPLASLRGEATEFGQVSGLIETAFAQRDELRREIAERQRVEAVLREREAELQRTMAEREQLGRNLHDGVIQSLYATGLGLRGIRTLLRPDQTEAAARLEQTRAALNETIHDVRNFIIGLEPEALKLQTFSQAVAVLLEIAQGIRAAHSAVDIDEALAAQLSLAQRFHALQVAREAISNALRHGEASTVRVELKPQGELVRFEISDDGRGFDPANRPGSGHGFSSFTQRARELGAELTIDSAPGQGTRVRLIFSPHFKS